MALHRLAGMVMGVPNVTDTARYYEEFGLTRVSATPSGAQSETEARFATRDGGEQLTIVHSPRRRVLQIRLAADSPDDILTIASRLDRLEIPAAHTDTELTTYDPGTEVGVVVSVEERREPPLTDGAVGTYNSPAHITRLNERTPGVLREGPVRPRKLGHVVMGSTDQDGSVRLFAEGIGFKISDSVKGRAAFMRCSTDHHNILIQRSPVSFLHHTSWQLDDIDEVGRGATAMLDQDPARHVWGMGRHHIGSNFFWYLRDPAGNFSEYYSDLDCIVDDELWTPRLWEGRLGLYNWGPPPPPSFLKPDDLAALMAGAHSPR